MLAPARLAKRAPRPEASITNRAFATRPDWSFRSERPATGLSESTRSSDTEAPARAAASASLESKAARSMQNVGASGVTKAGLYVSRVEPHRDRKPATRDDASASVPMAKPKRERHAPTPDAI